MTTIQFGTDGWRAIIDRDFTLTNVKIVAQAIADYMKNHNLDGKGIIVGYDTRKGSQHFAEGVCRVMLGNAISTFVTERDAPTPVTAFEVLNEKAGGAVMITASHNPPEWNGIKYIPDYAGPALPDITEEITKNIDQVLKAKTVKETSIERGTKRHLFKSIDPKIPYTEFVEKQIDLATMKKAKLKIVIDPMHGTARGYLDYILRDLGCEITIIHDDLDPTFGGARPEPLPEFLVSLKSKVVSLKADLGLATDGDADRLAVFDSDGTYLAANQLLPLLYDYLIKIGKRGGVVRSVSTTHFVDQIAKKHGFPVYEVPVGFKYVGQYLREQDVIIGAEESGGFSFKGHISEKDGIFTCIKVAEMRAKLGKPLSQLFDELQSEYGSFCSGRNEVQCPETQKQVVMERLSSTIPDKIIGIAVSMVNRIDGLKLILEDGGWLLIRPSGTESILRIYGETSTKETLKMLLKAGKSLVSKALNE
ncbi:phosphoglucomutase/phosphomannomutase family protein [Candidatus Borrarchaeum sp.]|uniref:phosphoglucomutase/phosphomannomutase family protein n=1 Tax=Candidatus Borrarchaeum sp. TaxID=2846742 RepID=UPI00257A95E1|nr:phosphoglucomutase/phosphomannomutase family protein [Candidatus Borrarchaeum sp.]